jgi:hypothetical protein
VPALRRHAIEHELSGGPAAARRHGAEQEALYERRRPGRLRLHRHQRSRARQHPPPRGVSRRTGHRDREPDRDRRAAGRPRPAPGEGARPAAPERQRRRAAYGGLLLLRLLVCRTGSRDARTLAAHVVDGHRPRAAQHRPPHRWRRFPRFPPHRSPAGPGPSGHLPRQPHHGQPRQHRPPALPHRLRVHPPERDRVHRDPGRGGLHLALRLAGEPDRLPRAADPDAQGRRAGTHNALGLAKAKGARSCSPPPRRSTAIRWSTRSRRATGATSTPSARAASTTRPSASPRR